MMRFLDTNIFVRGLTNDHATWSERCRRLLIAIDEGAAEAAVQRAKEAMARKDLGSEETAAVQAALAKSLAQLHVKRRRRS